MRKFRSYLWLVSVSLLLFLVSAFAALLLIKVERVVEAPGEVRIGSYQIVRPRVAGIIGEVQVGPGVIVTSGQTLCTLIDYEFEKQQLTVLQQLTEATSRKKALTNQHRQLASQIHPLERSRQAKRLAGDRLERDGAGFRTREAAVEFQRAEEKLQRMRELGEAGLASEQAINEAQFDREQAELRLEQSKIDERFSEDKSDESGDDYRLLEAGHDRDLASVSTELEQLEILLEQLTAQKEQLDRLSSFYELRAEIDGLVLGARPQDLKGRKVQAGEDIFSIVDTASVHFVANVPDAAIVKIRPGQPVNIELTGLPTRDFDIFRGEISQVSQEPQLTQSTEEILYPVEIRMADPFVLWEGNRFYLRTGMRGIAKISYRSDVRLLRLIYELLIGDQAGGRQKSSDSVEAAGHGSTEDG